MAGDLNGRIATLSDTTDIDDIRPRHVLDECKAGHGESLIEFLIDSKQCVLNGRFDVINNNFTCIPHKGKSVVDYIITPHDCLNKCSNFKVITSNDAIDMCSLSNLISSRCKPPDHSIVSCQFQTLHSLHYEPDGLEENVVDQKDKKYRFQNIAPDFMNNDLWRLAVNDLIDVFSVMQQRQEEIDTAYTQFCNLLYNEIIFNHMDLS